MSLLGELLDAERQGWQALTSAEGPSYYREHLADHAVMVFSSGVMSRADALEAMASAPPWSSFEILDPQVVELTPDSGVLVYRAAAQRADQPVYKAMITSVFVRAAGVWKLAVHHQTPV
jgi:hypothetical protein